VLDRARAGADRALRSLGAVGVHRDEGVVPGRLLDGGPDLLLAQLGRAGHAAAGQDRARPEALDQVRAADQQATNSFADVVDRGHDAELQVVGQPDVAGEADDVAAAPRRGDEGAGALHPRADDVAAIDRVAQAQSVKARNGPRSRTVVNPASIVCRAWRTPIRTSSAAEVVVAGTSAVWTSPTRWVWRSIRPGRTVNAERSTTAASSGIPSPRRPPR
jgi:hypothetical protein